MLTPSAGTLDLVHEHGERSHTTIAHAVLDPDGQMDFQQAGLIVRRDDASSVLRIDISYVDACTRSGFVRRNNGVDRKYAWLAEDSALAPPGRWTPFWMRITNHGVWLTASYSIDGATFVDLAASVPADQLAATDAEPFTYPGDRRYAHARAHRCVRPGPVHAGQGGGGQLRVPGMFVQVTGLVSGEA